MPFEFAIESVVNSTRPSAEPLINADRWRWTTTPHQHHQLGTVRFQDDGMISVNIWPRWSNGPWITVTSIVVSLSMDRWIIVAGDFYCRFIASSFILRFFIFTFKPTWFALSHRSRSTGQFFLFNFIFFLMKFHQIEPNLVLELSIEI